MLLAINIGNSNLRFGIFKGRECLARWIINTKPLKSADEYVVIVNSMISQHGFKVTDIDELVIASVVPALSPEFAAMNRELFGKEAVFINYRMKTGLTFPIETPDELGADLLANAAAAANLYDCDVIVVDFGTALSFTIVKKDGYLSGIVIAPGVISALGSLVADTAQLPQIELRPPARVIGLETIECIQSGIIHGYTGLIENIVNKIDEEQNTESLVIATGGTAHVFHEINGRIDLYDDIHTLKGLQIIHELNAKEV